MSILADLESKVERVIRSATDHARFTGTLAADIAGIEAKVAEQIGAAKDEILWAVDARLRDFESRFVGDVSGVSRDSADSLDQAVGKLTGAAPAAAADSQPAQSSDPQQAIDPNTGLPLAG